MMRAIDHNQVNSPWCKGGHHVGSDVNIQEIPVCRRTVTALRPPFLPIAKTGAMDRPKATELRNLWRLATLNSPGHGAGISDRNFFHSLAAREIRQRLRLAIQMN